MNVVTRATMGIGAFALSIAMLGGGPAALAQTSDYANSIESPIVNASGETVGTLYAGESDSGVTFTVLLEAGALEAGEHGVHIHETGSCDPAGESTFELAGGHFNPTDATHGAPGDEMSHAGDLGNLTVAEDGSSAFTVSTAMVTFADGVANSLLDADGSALVIHAGADDLATDPSGESGDRLFCSVIASGTDATVVASPNA